MAGTFLVVGPIAGGLTFPLIIGIDHLIWPDNHARFALAGMLLVGAVLTLLPALVAGIAGAITSRLLKRRTAWLGQAAAFGAAMTQSATRTLMLIVMFGIVRGVAGLAGAAATQGWRPKSLTGLYAETFD